MQYTDIQHTDFWTFFNILEAATSQNGNITMHELKTGGFQDSIDIIITEQDDLITDAELILANPFVGDTSSVNALAKDIAKSFILALDPQATMLASGIWDVMGSKQEIVHIGEQRTPTPLSSPAQQFVDTFVGKTHSAVYESGTTTWQIERDERETRIVYRLDTE